MIELGCFNTFRWVVVKTSSGADSKDGAFYFGKNERMRMTPTKA